jgi:hypothetical protein
MNLLTQTVSGSVLTAPALLYANVFGALTLIVLIVVIIWVIIDLDRPRRGLILVSQQSMISLQESLNKDIP